MKKIGIIGGTFNPVQSAHIAIAEIFLKELGLDTCIFIPAALSPFKTGDPDARMLEDRHRVEMLRLAIANHNQFSIDTFEIDKGGISHTIDTVLYLNQKYPSDDIYLLIGGDHVSLFHEWKDWKEILRQIQLCIAERPGTISEQDKTLYHQKLSMNEKSPLWLPTPLLEISSTDIRDKIRMGDSISDMIPAEVEKYIKENSLFL